MNAPHDRSPAGAHKQDDPAPVCAPLSAAAAPAGWKLVPAEPTPEMLSEIKFYDGITDAAMAARYKGMLAAAPCAPTSAAIDDDDALTVAYMVGYAKGKDGALASPVGTVAWADRRDALRYRWLRDPAHSLPDGGEPFLAKEALDAAIDAALASPAGTVQPTSAAAGIVQPVAMDDDPCRATRAGLSGPVPRWETFRPTPPTPASEAVVQDAARREQVQPAVSGVDAQWVETAMELVDDFGAAVAELPKGAGAVAIARAEIRTHLSTALTGKE